MNWFVFGFVIGCALVNGLSFCVNSFYSVIIYGGPFKSIKNIFCVVMGAMGCDGVYKNKN